MSKKLIFYLSCAVAILVFVLLRIGVVRASKPGQTNILKWQQDVSSDINTQLFEQIIKKGDVEGARQLLEKYEKQEPTKEAPIEGKKEGEIVVKEPLKAFLRQTSGNYPHIKNQMPIQGVFYDLAQSSGQRRDNLNQIALLFIDKTDPEFFTNNETNSLNEVPTQATSQKIPYLHFALKYGLVDVANALLNKTPSLANALVDGKSAFVYTYEGGIAGKTLLKSLVDKQALLQEADFDYFTDQPQKIAFLAWIKENKIPTANATAKIAPLEKEAEALVAQRNLDLFAQSLKKILHPQI